MAESMIPTELGTKKISTLLRMYAVPGIIAMTAASLYNMVDSIYIGHIKDVGAMAISGLAVASPLMNLSAALGTLVGIGASTTISVLLGQKNYEKAQNVLANEVSLNTIIGIAYSILMLSFLEPILRFFGATDAIMPYAKPYMFVNLLGNVITHLYFGLNSCIRASGNPKLAMNMTLFTVILNAVLDPILIFGFHMGVVGAAVATVIAQFSAFIRTMFYFLDKKNFLHFPEGIFRYDGRIAMECISIGVGPFLVNAANCIVVMFINQQLLKYSGELAIGAYGIQNRITFFFLMIAAGINQGLQPIAGYNFGARLYSRVRKVYWTSIGWVTVATVTGFIICEAFPGAAVSIFTNDPTLREMSARALRICNLMLPVIGFHMVTTQLFQCLGMIGKGIILSLSRQILIMLPLLYILPLFLGHDGVWLTFPASDFLAFLLALCFFFWLIGKMKKLKDGDEPVSLGSSLA